MSDRPGGGIIVAATIGTAVFVVSAAAGIAAPDALDVVVAAVSLVLFATGCVAFLWAYGTAVNRSRHDVIGIAGLYFLQGTAPPDVRWRLLGAAAAQTVVAIVAASVRPFTALAFGVLVPMFGLGLAGLWAARYGTFAPRSDSAGSESSS